MTELLTAAAASFGEAPFLVEGGSVTTFRAAARLVERRALHLPAREVLAIAPSPTTASVIEILAGLRGGKRTVLVPTSWPASRVAGQLESIGPSSEPETIVFTSGSGGSPKAVRLLERNWLAAATNSSAHFGFTSGKRWLAVLPLFHVGGLSIVFRSLVSGGATVLASDLDPARLDAVDFASLVPTQLHRLVRERPAPGAEILVGGAFLSAPLVASARSWRLHRTYGMTETAAVVASGSPEREWMQPLAGIEISTTATSRLKIRGAQVSPGYVGERERASHDWFETADLGEEKEGEIRVTGRADRVIVTGGEKVDPDEVESVLRDHPAITDVAVVGLPDEEWGEVVAVAYSGEATAAEVIERVEASLGPLARPRRLARCDEIPRTELGKLDLLALFPTVSGARAAED